MFTDDEDYIVFDDSTVLEMMKVMHERYPKFHELKAKEFIKRAPDTIVHGDFHSGNMMVGQNENEGKWELINSLFERTY